MKKPTDHSNHDRFVDLGLLIEALRKRQGLSQEQFAEKAEIARSTLSAIEAANNSRAFSVDTLFKIADAPGISAGDLLNHSLPASNM